MHDAKIHMRFTTLTVAVGLACGAAAANASLVLLGPADIQSPDSTNTLLTITSPNSTSTEEGAVALTSAGALSVSGNTVGINQTRTLAEIGTTTASDLRIVFNATEPGSASGITLEDLVLTLQPASGASTPAMNFTSGTFTPVDFASTLPGIGNSGYVFALNPAQTVLAQAAIDAGANVVGLSARASSATGGSETFFVTTNAGLQSVVGPVPEPGTLTLLASGVIAAGVAARRRKQR